MDPEFPEGELPGRLRAIAKSTQMALIAWAENNKGDFMKQLEYLRIQVPALMKKIPASWWPHG